MASQIRARVCSEAGCPVIYRDTTKSGKCPEHRAEAERLRGTRTARGYGQQHVSARAALLPTAIDTPCPLCGRVMQQGDALDLDHSVPLAMDATAKGDRIVHASCNRARRT